MRSKWLGFRSVRNQKHRKHGVCNTMTFTPFETYSFRLFLSKYNDKAGGPSTCT